MKTHSVLTAFAILAASACTPPSSPFDEGAGRESQVTSSTSSALVTASPCPESLTCVEDYVESADDGDWALAFERAFQSPSCGPGCIVQLRRFTYDLKTQIDVPKPVYLRGMHALRTQLRVLTGTTAIVFRYSHWATLKGLGTGSEGSTLENLTVKEVSRPVKVKPRVGVGVQAPMTIRDVRIDGFYRGLEIDAGAKRGGWSVCETTADCPPNSVCSSKRCRSTYATNANTAYIENVHINGTDDAAVFVDGPDANAGTLTGIIVKGACFRPMLEDDSTCAGVYEGSFLGNMWSGLHVAQAKSLDLTSASSKVVVADGIATVTAAQNGARDRVTGELASVAGITCAIGQAAITVTGPTSFTIPTSCPAGQMADGAGTVTLPGKFYPGAICANDNNRSTFLGTYFEEDMLAGVLAQGCESIGGKSHWNTGGGLVINARTITMPVIIAPTIRSRPVSTTKLTNLMRWEIANPDGSMRSFYMVDGDYMLNANGTPAHPTDYEWIQTTWKGGPGVEMWKNGTRR